MGKLMTVKELIHKLGKVSQDKSVFIRDLDTDYLLPDVEVQEWDHHVTLHSDGLFDGYAPEELTIDGHLMDCEAHNGD